jgi:hypothetical protein
VDELKADDPERDGRDHERREARRHLLLGQGENADVPEDHGAHERGPEEPLALGAQAPERGEDCAHDRSGD